MIETELPKNTYQLAVVERDGKKFFELQRDEGTYLFDFLALNQSFFKATCSIRRGAEIVFQSVVVTGIQNMSLHFGQASEPFLSDKGAFGNCLDPEKLNVGDIVEIITYADYDHWLSEVRASLELEAERSERQDRQPRDLGFLFEPHGAA
jgi:hypothetical protein